MIRHLKKITKYFNICAKISSVHGVNHIITTKTLFERCLWILFILIASGGYITLAYKTWDRYQVRPTVVTFDLDFYNWNLTFPSISMCLGVKDETIDNYLNTNYNLTNQEKEEFKYFFNILYQQNSLRNFRKLHDFDKFPTEKYLDTILELTNDFQPYVETTFKTTVPYIKYITEGGVCFAFNSEIASYFTDSYWKEDRWDLFDSANNTLKINANILGGMTATVSYFDHKFTVFLHSYNDVIDLASPKYTMKEKGILRLFLKLESMWTTTTATKLTPSQRECRLQKESNLKHSPVYSYRLCLIECRIQLMLHFCKCLPYFYRRLGNENICNPQGMRCIGYYADILETVGSSRENNSICICPAHCHWDNSLVDNFEEGNWMFGSSFSWELIEFPKKRYRRKLLFGITNVMISIGGMAGLFLGCGVLSFIEIFYFLSLKLFWYIYSSNNNNKK